MARLIVSCTTTHARLRFLYFMLESLKTQTVRPDLVLVNLSSTSYLLDEGILTAPEWVAGSNVEVNWVENTGPYRKLLPAVEIADSNDLILTADDDIIYGPRWVEQLLALARKHDDQIVSARARVIKRSLFGGWQNYRLWSLYTQSVRGFNILPTNGAGTVLRKELLDLDFLFDKAYGDLAPTTDDLWIRVASMRKGVDVVVQPSIDKENVYLLHDSGLCAQNQAGAKGYWGKVAAHTLGNARAWLGVPESENDRCWRRILRYSESRLGVGLSGARTKAEDIG